MNNKENVVLAPLSRYIINPHEEGICRTLKAQYAKTSAANFLYKGSFGATGVIEIYEERIDNDRSAQ